jgi:hypothetical protein
MQLESDTAALVSTKNLVELEVIALTPPCYRKVTGPGA